jgi:4,5-dihydroxyphthalate decarboxylase
MSIRLSIACGDRDVNRSLLTGDVEPDGVDATVVSEYPPKRHRRFFEHGEYDVCEVSLASYLSSRSAPEEYPFTAIPAFTNKRFRHSFFFKHADADVDGPADLAGKTVGVQSWQTTANVWMRGIAQEHYGLDLADVTWYRRRKNDVPISIPDRFDVRPVPGKQGGDAVEEPRDLRDMLFAGDLDAAMDPAASMFHAVVESDEAEFVFDDPLQEEREYYEETGIHPIMHTVAIRDEVLEEHPWVARNVYEAFAESRDRAIERHRSISEDTVLTWAHLHLLEQDELLGPDALEHGLTADNRRALNAFIAYADDQGLIPHAYDPEELFVERTLDL